MFPRLKNTTPDRNVADITVESKSYIMARIGWDFRTKTVYWQLVDPDYSLLELGFEWPTGRLVDCSVPLFNGDIENAGREPAPKVEHGAPLFDLSLWPSEAPKPGARDNYLKQAGRISLVRTSEGVLIACQDEPRLRSIVYGEKLLCHFGQDDELVGLTLMGNFPTLAETKS
jgi:hypothetical protein